MLGANRPWMRTVDPCMVATPSILPEAEIISMVTTTKLIWLPVRGRQSQSPPGVPSPSVILVEVEVTTMAILRLKKNQVMKTTASTWKNRTKNRRRKRQATAPPSLQMVWYLSYLHPKWRLEQHQEISGRQRGTRHRCLEGRPRNSCIKSLKLRPQRDECWMVDLSSSQMFSTSYPAAKPHLSLKVPKACCQRQSPPTKEGLGNARLRKATTTMMTDSTRTSNSKRMIFHIMISLFFFCLQS
mmetsp:Transcript_41420/g.99225  ORF Transcript_41420/g.99225 Transcript_41420/m.99225 type:complete len:242 (-) Transcript_41420:40-765(-)